MSDSGDELMSDFLDQVEDSARAALPKPIEHHTKGDFSRAIFLIGKWLGELVEADRVAAVSHVYLAAAVELGCTYAIPKPWREVEESKRADVMSKLVREGETEAAAYLSKRVT